jgi:hypothetical protein
MIAGQILTGNILNGSQTHAIPLGTEDTQSPGKHFTYITIIKHVYLQTSIQPQLKIS